MPETMNFDDMLALRRQRRRAAREEQRGIGPALSSVSGESSSRDEPQRQRLAGSSESSDDVGAAVAAARHHADSESNSTTDDDDDASSEWSFSTLASTSDGESRRGSVSSTSAAASGMNNVFAGLFGSGPARKEDDVGLPAIQEVMEEAHSEGDNSERFSWAGDHDDGDAGSERREVGPSGGGDGGGDGIFDSMWQPEPAVEPKFVGSRENFSRLKVSTSIGRSNQGVVFDERPIGSFPANGWSAATGKSEEFVVYIYDEAQALGPNLRLLRTVGKVIDEVMDTMDADESGFLEEDELRTALYMLGIDESEVPSEPPSRDLDAAASTAASSGGVATHETRRARPRTMLERLTCSSTSVQQSWHVDSAKSFARSVSVWPRIPVPLLKQLRKEFSRHDIDGDGIIDKETARFVMSQLDWNWSLRDVADLSANVSSSRDDQVAFTELVRTVAVYFRNYSDRLQSGCTQLFNALDRSHNGRVDGHTMYKVLIAIGLSEEDASREVDEMLEDSFELDAVRFSQMILIQHAQGETWPRLLTDFMAIYAMIDLDQSGVLDRKELETLLRRLDYDPDDAQRVRTQLLQGGRSGVTLPQLLEFALRDETFSDALASLQSVAISLDFLYNEYELNQLRDVDSFGMIQRFAARVVSHVQQQSIGQLRKFEESKERVFLKLKLRQEALFKLRTGRILCIARATMMGAFVAAVGVVGEETAKIYFPVDEGSYELTSTHVMHYTLIYFPAIIFSAVEVLYLSWDFFHTAINTCARVGIRLWPLEEATVVVMFHAVLGEALELGHSSDAKFGVNPLVNVSDFQMIACGILYKMRAGLAKFMTKVAAKRMLARGALKGTLSAAAVPILALMNMVLAMGVTFNTSIVTFGRLVVTDLADAILDAHAKSHQLVMRAHSLKHHVDRTYWGGARLERDILDQPMPAPSGAYYYRGPGSGNSLSTEARRAVMRAISVVVGEQAFWHPNVEALLVHIMFRLNITPEDKFDQVESMDILFREELPQLPPLEALCVIRLYALATFVDGSANIAEKLSVGMALRSCRLPPDTSDYRQCQLRFQNLLIEPEDCACMFRKAEKAAIANTITSKRTFDESDAQHSLQQLTLGERIGNQLTGFALGVMRLIC